MPDSLITQLVTVQAVVEALGISRASIYRLIGAHALPSVKIGGRLRFDPAQIERFIDAHRRDTEQRTDGATT